MSGDQELFTAGGETGRLMAARDWAATDLGPVRDWPQSLRAAVRIVLSSRYPMLLLWGPDFTQLYNDAYSALIGDKHPAALGLDVRITLAEGWDVLGPLINEAMRTGVASWVPALQLLLDRSGYREEAYFSVSHAPARDDDGVTVGVLTVCSEVTDQVVGERRLRLLRDLALPAGSSTAGVEETCAQLCEVIGEHPLDVPFAAVYLRDGDVLRRCATVGADPAALPAEVVLDPRSGGPEAGGLKPGDPEAGGLKPGGPGSGDPWRLRVAAGGETAEMTDVAERLALTGGPWLDPVSAAVAQPLPSADRSQPAGVLLTGLSPSRGLDETYRSFLQLLAQQVAVAVRNARAFQDERDRAAALAELDRVKTDFFTNVSHEFRTPLTLMLGPLADALADAGEPLGEAQRARVDTASRNAGRLLNLVNELLTFASIGAGEPVTAPRAVDLAAFTRELAGVFRAAVERTGLRLVVDAPPLPRAVAIDPGHWEKIVTNLLSNALKFTFVGEIGVRLESDATAVRLTVSDTGIGIDATEMPRLFDRFHRVRGARSRSHEGTGIGLALVRELTRLIGGDVEVRSAPGEGTAFTVVLPWTAVEPAGAAPADRGPELEAARAAAASTAGWASDTTDPDRSGPGASVLVADDNSDMRAYLSRLLTAEGWQVRTATDGESALQSIRRNRPDLLITDVMMPRLDGFGLVRALRDDEGTRGLPILMLSARAGQESGVEGLVAGADDYVVKPFSARELMARVRNMLELARARAVPHGGPSGAVVGATAVIAAGRAMEEAFRAATDQACSLLGAVSAVTVVDGAVLSAPPAAPAAAPGSAAAAGAAPAGGPALEAGILDAGGLRIGGLTVRYDSEHPPAPGIRTVLTAMTEVLGLLARCTWQPGAERDMALTLHQALSPESRPAPDGWDVHAAYQPSAGDRAGAGWSDTVEGPDGTLLISVGHVAGDGLAAAARAGQVRAAIRAWVSLGRDPAPMIGRPAGTAVLLVRLDPRTGRFTTAVAGDPALDAPTLVADPHSRRSGVLEPGATLLLHTAGVKTAAVTAAPLVTLVDDVVGGAPRPHDDDVAVIAVRRRPVAAERPVAAPRQTELTRVYPLDPAAAGAARRDLAAALDGDDVDQDLLYDLQVAVTEAINNAVEHAQDPSRPEVRVHLRVTGGLVRIEVQDFGGWRARPAARDRGRGAILMNAYGDVRVVTNDEGTLVTIERRWDG